MPDSPFPDDDGLRRIALDYFGRLTSVPPPPIALEPELLLPGASTGRPARGRRLRPAFMFVAVVVGLSLLAFGMDRMAGDRSPNPAVGPGPVSVPSLPTCPAGPASGVAGPQPSRVAAGMAYDEARNEVVLFGGYRLGSSEGALDDTWVWDGHGWTQRVLAVRPPGRQQAVMVYDAARQRTVLFGGVDTDGTPYDDTWTWDGSAWHLEKPAASPPPRSDAAAAYDDALGKVVLFGGWNLTVGIPAKLNDTWTWDGSTWTQAQTVTRPAKRASAVMAYHAGSRRLVMFGGITGNMTDETWLFDGQDWAQAFPGGGSAVPAGRDAAVMARNDATGTLVLFGGEAVTGGGSNTVQASNDTWTWDGRGWTEQHPPTAPPARGVETLAGNLAYDRALGMNVLYGGMSGSPPALGDTWTWNGAAWSRISDSSTC